MKKIVVLGAGQSAPFLIRYLLDLAAERGWVVTVGDLDPDLAAARVAGHPRGQAVAFDAGCEAQLASTAGEADLVVNLMPPELQLPIARQCVRRGTPMVSASYATPEIRALGDEAARRGVLLLMEIGLDPGIDHMAAMALVDRVHRQEGIVESFVSYGSGVPAPESVDNPLAYAITWSPRSVVLAGRGGAHFLRDGRLRAVPKHRVFDCTWPVEVEGVGQMTAYPNRDSLAYRRIFGLTRAKTLIRGTLRHPGFCRAWRQIVRLGLNTERISVPRLAERSFAELVEMFLPAGLSGATVLERTAEFLGLSADDPTLASLRWLGLFSTEPTGVDGATVTDALAQLLLDKLRLPAGGRDMVVLLHELLVRYPVETIGRGSGGPARRERITATLVQYGVPDGVTAMARTVGLPAALAARLALDGEIALVGCHIPTEPAVYEPVLTELGHEGIRFVERVEPARRRHQQPEGVVG
jgi:saccharopine dehydrogenase-like NADP-dependent oxidoreductase